MENKYDLLEKRIRIQLGNKIYREADLPLSVEGTPLYNDPITLEVYRKYFRKSDNEITAYLTLAKNEYFSIRPEMAGLLRRILNSELLLMETSRQEEEGGKEESHSKSKEMKDKIKEGFKKLIEIVEKEFPK